MLEILTALNSPCGGEEHIKKYIKTKLSEAYEDATGNLIFHKKGGEKKLVIFCAVDEDAVVVMSSKDKKINFAHVGDKKIHAGDTVSFGGYKGLICTDNKEKCNEDLYIKMIGDVEVENGCIGVLDGEYYEEENIAFMKEAASKLTLCSMLECAENETKFDTYFVFGVLGKKGSRGLVAVTREIKPDKVLIFEQTENEKVTVKLLASGFMSNKESAEDLASVCNIEKEVNSEAKTSAAFCDCADTVCVGVPVKYGDNIRQEINLEVKDRIKDIITKTMKGSE